MQLKDQDIEQGGQSIEMAAMNVTLPSKTPESKAGTPGHHASNSNRVSLDLTNLTPHQVAREGNVQLMEMLLARILNPQLRKKKINARDEERLTPLHYAAKYNQYCMMVYLLENGADAQIKGEDDATPLHYLAKYKKKSEVSPDCTHKHMDEDQKDCIKLLMDNGADINARDAMGLTPLHLACVKKNVKFLQNILQYPSLLFEATDNQQMTALHLSCIYGRKEAVKMLLEAGASLRCRDKDLSTPFHLACAEGSKEIAQMLLDKADEVARSAPAEEAVYAMVNESTKAKYKRTNSQSSSKSGGTFGRLKIHDVDRKTSNTAASNNLATAPTRGGIDLVQDTDADKNLPLHLAIENGHLDVVKLCIEQGKLAGVYDIVHACRVNEDSCLHLAVNANSLEITQYLLSEGIDINARNADLMTPLMVGCQQNTENIVKYLVKNGANVELKDSDYMTPLMMACRYGHYESILCLLEHGADVTETDKDDKTCLMFAAEENKTEAVTLLLSNDNVQSMIEERDKFNNTALHLASMKGHSEVVKLLLEHQASADTKNDDDRTTLHMAALFGHEIVIPELVEKDRSILNSSDEDANTALHLAAMSGNLKSAVALVNLGANLEITNTRQWTPLDSAAAHGWEKIVTLFLDSGASIQPKGKSEVAALHLACQRGHVNVVKLLLQWKADVTFKASDGRNALDFAIDFGQKDCVMALINHETWLKSMKNTTVNPVTGQMMTPMRKLIMKMEDMAMVVYDQCITDNGKKPENDDYTVTLMYELLDDMYSSTLWADASKIGLAKLTDSSGKGEEMQYAVYDDNDELTSEAQTYSSVSDVLKENHPLQIMVTHKKENLLLHPVVTGLLNYKWRQFGRYVYYFNLSIYLAFMIILNCYMLLQPPLYRLNWEKIFQFRRYLRNGRNATGSFSIPKRFVESFASDSPACWYYRYEVIEDITLNFTPECYTEPQHVLALKWVVFAFAIVNLFRELIQLLTRKLAYLEVTNVIEVTLYVLSLLITLDFHEYPVNDATRLTASNWTESSVEVLYGFQRDTGLRQHWQEQIGAFAVFLSWMVLLLFIQKLPRLGIFVVMFTDILKTFAEFFVVFALFVLAFSLSFTILLGNQQEFEHWYEALVKTTVMMIGELDYGTIFYSANLDASSLGKSYHSQVYQREISIILFVIFLLVMTIIIMNLLVGLAVGDIMQVQENATLQRLGMQVKLALEVEFTLPSFVRKKMFKRKQIIQVNKYRNANFIRRFLKEDVDLRHKISAVLAEEEKMADEPRTAEDKLLNGLNLLRGRVLDVLSEQADLKTDLRGVRSLVRKSQVDSVEQAKEIKQNLETSSANLSVKIDSTRSGLAEKTQTESNQTRDRVQGTLSIVSELKEDLDHTKQSISEVKEGLEKKIENVQEEILSQNWKEVDKKVQSCNERIEETRNEIIGSLNEMKKMLVTKRYMTSV